MRPSAAHAPGLEPRLERLIVRAARRQRKAVQASLSSKRRGRGGADEVEVEGT